MLELVCDAERTSSEIAQAVGATRPAEVRAALERFWGERPGRLSAAVAAGRERGPAGETR